MSIVLLTGANGFVGSHVLPALLGAGHAVKALVRDDAAAREVDRGLTRAQRAGVDIVMGDVTRPDTLPAAVQGATAVVHLVAIPRDGNDGTDLLRVNTDGTRNVVDAARTAGVRRFVHQSAMGVEEDPALHYATSKALGERYVRESDLDWTVLRPSLLWGEGDGFFSLIAGLTRWSPGIAPVPGRGRSRFQPLWVEDLARIVVLCLERPETIGQTYDLGGPAYWTYAEITREVLMATGRQRIVVPMPVPLISLVARSAEFLHAPFPVASDQLRQLKRDTIGPLDGVRRAFGFDPRPMNGHLGYLRRGRSRPASTAAGI